MNQENANPNAHPSSAPVAPAEQQRAYDPALSFYHPHVDGSGSVMKVEYRKATAENEASVTFVIAKQVPGTGNNGTFPRFDYDNRIAIKLGFFDLSKILQVLRGETDTIERGGIVRKKGCVAKSLNVTHLIGQSYGTYRFRIEKIVDVLYPEKSVSAEITLSACESLGLSECISLLLPRVAFGNI